MRAHAAVAAEPAVESTPLRGTRRPLVQRRCGCAANAGSRRKRAASVEIGRPDDVSERAADHVADRVAGFAGQRAEAVSSAPGYAPSSAIRAALTGGEALPGELRRDFEQQLGRDLASVRIHRSPSAAASADALGARAYTYGSDIAFAAGEYAPATRTGRWLIAHEVAHVVQQTQPGLPAPRIQRQVRVGTCSGKGPFDCAGTRCKAASGRLGVCMWISSTRTCFCRDQSGDEPAPAAKRVEDVLPEWLIVLIGAAAVAALVACFATGVCEVGAIVAAVGEGLAELVILLARGAGIVVLASNEAPAGDGGGGDEAVA